MYVNVILGGWRWFLTKKPYHGVLKLSTPRYILLAPLAAAANLKLLMK